MSDMTLDERLAVFTRSMGNGSSGAHDDEPADDYGDEPPWEPPGEEGQGPDDEPNGAAPALEIIDIDELVRRVDAMPAPTFLARPVWPADAYGVLAAEDKAGKTWLALDLAVSKAAGVAWLGIFPCENPGPVLVFAGEGGERKIVRRLRAVAAAREVPLAGLPLRVCMRVPHLTDTEHLDLVGAEVAEHRPELVIIDPLYLAARGAKGSDLYEMGAHLERVQHLVQRAGAALLVLHHWNKTGEGKGSSRMSGAGPGAWGRVLVSVAVEARHTEDDGTSVVKLSVEFKGDEIAETDYKFRRRVWADDRDDLNSSMHYEVDHLESTESASGEVRPTLLMQRVSIALEEEELPLSANAIAKLVEGQRQFLLKALKLLVAEGYVAVEQGRNKASLHRTVRPYRRADDPLDDGV